VLRRRRPVGYAVNGVCIGGKRDWRVAAPVKVTITLSPELRREPASLRAHWLLLLLRQAVPSLRLVVESAVRATSSNRHRPGD